MRRSSRRFRSAGGTILGLALLLASASTRGEELPSASELLADTPFEEKDVTAVMKGKVAVTDVAAVSDRELAVGLACLVRGREDATKPFATTKTMLDLSLVEAYEPADGPVSADAFQALDLGPDFAAEAQRYLDHEPGLGLNLSRDEMKEIAALRKDGATEPGVAAVESTIRQLLEVRLAAYRDGGLAGIAHYARAEGRSAEPGRDLRRSLAEVHRIEKIFPAWIEMWNEFPASVPRDASQRFHAIRSTIRDRPALLLAHQVAWQQGEARLVGERHYYVSHFFDGAQIFAVSIPVAEGTLFALIERVWVDGFSGMVGVKRTVGQRVLRRRVLENVEDRRACIAGD